MPCFSLKVSLYFLRISITGPISTSLKVVSMAVVFLASTSLLDTVLRRLLILVAFSSRLNIGLPGVRPGFSNADKTSCFSILPLVPLPVTVDGFTFLSAIMALATGVAFTSDCTGAEAGAAAFSGCAACAAGAADVSCAGAAGAAAPSGRAASSSILQATSSIFNVSPSCATICRIPAFSALSSNVAFSDSNSQIISSLSTHSPSFLIH